MKRLHIHLRTQDLEQSVAFYSAMFGAGPTRLEADYAKWLLDDPYANISLSTHAGATGDDHVGISVDSREALNEIAGRLKDAGSPLFAEEATTCCYAQSNKYWARDPQDARWELFQTFGDSDTYGAEPERDLTLPSVPPANACCASTT
jgi:catechol 2,3-dioxygenase-like lactoylglutathione lyase family enzyme